MNKLQASIEFIYIQVGQYDWYCSFDFRPQSEAWTTYGDHVSGIVIYSPSERLQLEKLVAMPNNEIPSSDGIVRLDGVLKDKELNSKLSKEGFKASDISVFYTVGPKPAKAYNQKIAIKEIPHTINVDFDVSDITPNDFARQELMIFNWRLRDGPPLIEWERIKYDTLVYILTNDTQPPDSIIDNRTGKIYRDALIVILGNKCQMLLKTNTSLITGEEYAQLELLLRTRRVERLEIVKRQLGISKRQLDEFKNTNPSEHKELQQAVSKFEDNVLVTNGFVKPIYWNFDRYIHIFLRHYKAFYIASSTKVEGTPFLYIYKDIIRLIKIVIEANREEINLAMLTGKEYRRYKDHGYYFNGNHYTFRISSNGLLLQFHPQE